MRQFNQHYKGGILSEDNFDDIENEYSFTGLLEKSTRKHHAGNPSLPELTVVTEQTYDHMDRPIDTWTTVDNGTRTLIARNGYNEIGQLKKKKLGSEDNDTSFGQELSYTYNERGWLRESNSALFSQELKYNEGAVPQYNGNISQQVFTRFDLMQPIPSPVTDTYSYDHLGRLTEGSMTGGKGRETLAYDRMGNIHSLVRTDPSSSVVDQLDYSYIGNRLIGVSDVISGGTGAEPYQLPGATAYSYDGNGNMKSRINATSGDNDITDIIYNYLSLPSNVVAASGNVSYTYDASGRKLRSTNGIVGQTRDYVDGIEYVDGTIELIQHAEGRILNTGSGYLFEYYLKDHLGNNRSGFGEGTNVMVPNFSADYYPFGMQYQQYVRTGNPKNNYLYNGKELQDGLKLYDYGARLYDPVIGRWGTMDPLAENHYGFNPYNYVLNNPMSYIDPLGLDTLSINELRSGDNPGDRQFDPENDVVVLDAVSVTAPSRSEVRNYGGDGSGSFADKFMYGLDQVNQYLPTTHVLNSITYAFGGKDIMGNSMSLGEATLGAASVIPIGKVGGAAVRGVGNIATKGGTRLISQFSSGTIDDAVKLVANDANKLNHLFPAKHNLGSLVNKLGGQENTVRAVLNAANGKLPASGLFNNIPVNVGGSTVFIRGNVINGVPRLGTMFIP